MELMNSKLLKIVAPLAVVVVAVLVGRTIIANKPEAPQFSPPVVPVAVEATRVAPVDYPVVLRSEGTVAPRTQSTLIPQVSGQYMVVLP